METAGNTVNEIVPGLAGSGARTDAYDSLTGDLAAVCGVARRGQAEFVGAFPASGEVGCPVGGGDFAEVSAVLLFVDLPA